MENKYSYQGRFEIILPQGYYFSSSIIYNQDSLKIGEVVLDQQILTNPFNGYEFISISKNKGKITTNETEFSTDCFECEFIRSGSIKINTLDWYYIIQRSEYEGDDEWGFWNMFEFCTVNNGKVLLITFYNMNLEDLSTGLYKSILKSIKLN